MRRISGRSIEEAWDYHLGRNDTPNFTVGQNGRIELAKYLIDKILSKDLHRRPLRIIELGCGSGDITGPYANIDRRIVGPDFTPFTPEEEADLRHNLGHEQPATYYRSTVVRLLETLDTRLRPSRVPGEIEVIGIDVVPQAAVSVPARFPDMKVIVAPVEKLEPMECDILVMTEFLEHVIDPIGIVTTWGPLAKWMVIGHPLDEPDLAYEPGHNWSYTRDDWRSWFKMAGHQWWEEFRFPMAAWDAMILGHGCRMDQPAVRNIHPDA